MHRSFKFQLNEAMNLLHGKLNIIPGIPFSDNKY